MNASKLRPTLITIIILALFFGVALCFRVCLPYDKVFVGDWIKFSGSDPYYHMRLVDNLVHNFPNYMSIDPYFIYPGPTGEVIIRFFDWFMASIIWVIGLGAPTQHTIDMVGVYIPAVLGALTVFPIYFIGKELFGHWAGVISAGLIALMPGEFMGRSILGYTDHDTANTLFTATAILFVILALKAANQRGFTFGHLGRLDWASTIKPIVYSLLAGIFLGIYILSWAGALLFVFMLSIYFVIQFIIDHLKGKSTDYLCLVGTIVFFVALMIYPLIYMGIFYLVSLIIALLIPPVLNGVSRLMLAVKIKPAYYPLALAGLGLVGLGIFYILSPSLLGSMFGAFRIFLPTATSVTTIEMQPILSPYGYFSLAIVWGNFSTSFFLSLISLVILIYLVVKQGSAGKTLLMVWSLIILLAAVGQRRFGIYFAINAALLTGYLSFLLYYVVRWVIDYLRNERTDYMSWQVLERTDFPELVTQPLKLPTRAERRRAKVKKGREERLHPTIFHVSVSLWLVLIIFLLAFFPNVGAFENAAKSGFTFNQAWWHNCLVGLAADTAKEVYYAPSDGWLSSLDWLRENSPEPFGDPDFYYQCHKLPPPGESYQYPESAYGVTAWWDYGYLITRVGRRLPSANPSQDPRANTNVANLFLSQDEDSAREIMEKLDSSYVIIDYETTISKFWAIATWSGKGQSKFMDNFYVPQENQMVAVTLFYPDYYRSLSVRLYNFDCKAVTPEATAVISYKKTVGQKGEIYKIVTGAQEFGSYQEAEEYVLTHGSGNHTVVGVNPFVSPVPLEALEQYQLVHSSDSQVKVANVGEVPAVKVFKYTD